MRANPEFDVTKIVKVNIPSSQYRSDRYVNNFSEGSKGALMPILVRKAKNQTFDDTQDWRKKEGDLFIGKEKKASMPLYHPALESLRLAGSDLSINSIFTPKPELESKKVLKTILEDIEKEKDKNEEDDEDSNVGEDAMKAIKKDIAELAQMATMSNEAYQKKYGKKEKKKKQIEKEEKEEEEKRKQKEEEERKIRANTQANLKEEIHEDEDFEISDDEENKKKSAALEFDPTAENFRGLRIAKRLLKRMIQNRRKRKAAKSADPFNDLKFDEDFQEIGGIKVNYVSGGKRDTFLTEENIMEERSIPNRGHKEAKSPAPGGDVLGTFFAEDQNTGANEVVKQVAREAEGNFESLEPSEQLKAKQAEVQQIIDENRAELEMNEAFQGIKAILMGDKKKELEKLEAETKIREKKLKEKEAEPTQEEVEEQKIMAYYTKHNYENLKLEARFDYNWIPMPAFSSLFDVLPDKVANKKSEADAREIEKQHNLTMDMMYTMVELKKQKQKKGKKKKKDTSKKVEMGTATVMAASGGMPTSSGKSSDLGELSFDEADGEGDSSQGEEGDVNLSKGSEAKKSRKRLFMTNEKFIIQKPFPLNEVTRKDRIIAALNVTDAFSTSKSNQVMNKKSDKRQAVQQGGGDGNQIDFGTIAEKFERDRIDDLKVVKDDRSKPDKQEYSTLYQCIRESDSSQFLIEKFNWSGNQIMATRNFTLSQTDKTIGALNNQKLLIWLEGWGGLVATTRRYAREFVDSEFISVFLMLSVFMNTVVLGMDGLVPLTFNPTLDLINTIFTFIFTTELVIKLYGFGIIKYGKDPFNIFDCIIVTLSLVEFAIGQTSGSGGASSGIKAVRVFRIFRVLRVTRLLRSLKFMKVIIDVIRGTIEQFVYIALLTFLFIFIFTLIGMQVFGGKFSFQKPTDYNRFNFDSFWTSWLTIFDVFTQENWNGVLISVLRSDVASYIGVPFLIIWITIGNWIFLNLFLAILLDGFESSDALKVQDEIQQESRELDRIHHNLIAEEEEKRKINREEDEKAREKVMRIIDKEEFKDKQELRKSQAVYVIVRDQDEDQESLSEELDLKAYLERDLNKSALEINPYEGVDCNRSFYYFRKGNPIRKFCATVVAHPYFENFIIFLIVASSIKLVVETYLKAATNSDTTNNVLDNIDHALTVLFTIEAAMKIMRLGLIVDDCAYLKDLWCILDIIIVVGSIVDWASTNFNIPIIKVLRLLRILRPLRFLSKNPSMRILINALLASIVGVANVIIVILMIFIMFSILGSNLMKDKMGYCYSSSDGSFDYFKVSRQACTITYAGAAGENTVWRVWWWNWDNLVQGMVTLYVLATEEGWPVIMSNGIDASDDSIGPLYQNSVINSIFYMIFMMLGRLMF